MVQFPRLQPAIVWLLGLVFFRHRSNFPGKLTEVAESSLDMGNIISYLLSAFPIFGDFLSQPLFVFKIQGSDTALVEGVPTW